MAKRNEKGQFVSEEVKVPKKQRIPKCPPKNEDDGDKTPEVMEWYRKYKPKEYNRKYRAFEEYKSNNQPKRKRRINYER